jgi:DNA polymerase family A
MTGPKRLEDYPLLWACDTEFGEDPVNGLPIPRCVCAKELRSGRTVSLWADEAARLLTNPFSEPGRHSLIITWSAEAELLFFRAFGWTQPVAVYDAMIAFKMHINCRKLPPSLFPLQSSMTAQGRLRWTRKGVGLPSLVDAVKYFRLPPINEARKDYWRRLAMGFESDGVTKREGNFYSADEKLGLLNYCWTDVDPLAALFSRLIHLTPFMSVLLRGYFKAVLARASAVGLPVDMDAWGSFQQHGAAAHRRLVYSSAATPVLTVDGNVSSKKLGEKVVELGLDWKRTKTGKPDTSKTYLATRKRAHPLIKALWVVRALLSEMHPDRFKGIKIWPDGRHRWFHAACATKSGRNLNLGFLLAKSGWVRGFVVTPPGYRIVELDFKAEEWVILSALSKDPGAIKDCSAGDPYFNIAKRLGRIPTDGTGASHPKERGVSKKFTLARIYGAGVRTLACRIKKSFKETKRYLEDFRRHYPVLCEYGLKNYLHAKVKGYHATPFNWLIFQSDRRLVNGHIMKNLPIQSCGVDILHICAVLLADRGYIVIATIHDSVTILLPEAAWEADLARAVEVMESATAAILGGLRIKIDPVVYAPGERFFKPVKPGEIDEPRDRFNQLMELLQEQASRIVSNHSPTSVGTKNKAA